MSEADIQARQDGYLRAAQVYAILLVLDLCYAIYLDVEGHYRAMIIAFALVLMLASFFFFKEHFWYTQIKKAKVGALRGKHGSNLYWGGINVGCQRSSHSQTGRGLMREDQCVTRGLNLTVDARGVQANAASLVTDVAGGIIGWLGSGRNDLSRVFDLPSTDVSIQFLRMIFGQVGTVLVGGASPVVSEMFSIFNTGVLSFAGALVFYTSTKGVLESTQDMSQMGQKMGAMVWVRLSAGVAMLVPKFNGYSLIQVLVMWAVVQGVGFADQVWNKAVSELKTMGGGLTAAGPSSTVYGYVGTLLGDGIHPKSIRSSQRELLCWGDPDHGGTDVSSNVGKGRGSDREREVKGAGYGSNALRGIDRLRHAIWEGCGQGEDEKVFASGVLRLRVRRVVHRRRLAASLRLGQRMTLRTPISTRMPSSR